MPGATSYILCATPRTGSTHLCALLASTGVAGRPESYFREPDQEKWATRFRISVSEDGELDYAALVSGALRFGTTPNGVFAARVMWGTLASIVRGLDPHAGRHSDLSVLEDALGPLRFVHLRRRDVVRQAVSWARAEQSAYWQQGDEVRGEPRLDLDQVDGLVDTIHEHNAGWRSWFAAEGVTPLEVDYESLVADPEGTVKSVLRWINAHPDPGWTPESPHQPQADGLNADWVRRYRRAQSSAASEGTHHRGR